MTSKGQLKCSSRIRVYSSSYSTCAVFCTEHPQSRQGPTYSFLIRKPPWLFSTTHLTANIRLIYFFLAGGTTCVWEVLLIIYPPSILL